MFQLPVVIRVEVPINRILSLKSLHVQWKIKRPQTVCWQLGQSGKHATRLVVVAKAIVIAPWRLNHMMVEAVIRQT